MKTGISAGRKQGRLPRRGLPAFLALLLCGGLFCVALPPAEARIISRSAEVSVGREAAAQVEQFYTVDTDPVAVARVRQIGRRLSSAAKDVEFPFEFHVIESADVNAFALPGGDIYVFRGLLQLLPRLLQSPREARVLLPLRHWTAPGT